MSNIKNSTPTPRITETITTTNSLCKIIPFDDVVFTSNNLNTSNNNYNSSNCKLFGDYVISSSSYFNDETKPYKAFNPIIVLDDDKYYNDSVYWKCNNIENDHDFTPMKIQPYLQTPYNSGIYQGGGSSINYFITSVSNGKSNNEIAGEWIQVQLPSIVCLAKYSILTPVTQNTMNYFPLEFVVLGSCDGIKWYYIDNQLLDNTNSSDGKPIPFILNNINQYCFFRLVIIKMPPKCTIVRINQWNLFGNSTCITGNLKCMSNNIENFSNYSEQSGNNSLNSLNKQYSYRNIYPSLNNYSTYSNEYYNDHFLLEEPIFLEESIYLQEPTIKELDYSLNTNFIENSKKYKQNIEKDIFYENLPTIILLFGLFGSITFLLIKNK